MRARAALPFLLLASLCAAPGRSAGQGAAVAPAAAEDSLLGALIREAMDRNSLVKAAAEAARGARFRPLQARSLPNPMLSLDYTNDGISLSLGEEIMTTLALMWSQDLPFPGKRRLRGEILEQETAQSEQQVERVRLSVTAAVKRAYYGLILARELLVIIDEQAEIWRQIGGIARSRYSVGQATQQDVLRIQVEITRIEQLMAEQHAEADIRLAELNQLLNRPPDSPIETTARLALRPLERDEGDWIEWAQSVSPERKSAELSVERDGLAKELARKEFYPDLTLQGGYMNRGDLDPMWQAGVGFSLPIYRRRPASAVDEAEANRRASEHALASIELLLRRRTQERLVQIRTTEQIAALYGQGIITQDRLALEAAVSSYQVGTIPFISVLETLSTLYSDRSTYLGLLAEHEGLRASLEEVSLEPSAGMALPAGMAPASARLTGGEMGGGMAQGGPGGGGAAAPQAGGGMGGMGGR